MLRRIAGPGLALLVGAGLTVGGWTNHVAGAVLIGMAILWGLWLLPTVGSRLPSLSLERSDGIALRVRRPPEQGKRRLRGQTEAVVKEIWAYLRSVPDSSVASHRGWSQMVRITQEATDEGEKRAAWSEYTAAETARYSSEQRELAERFGGRIQYLVDEYQRRGTINESDARLLMWQSGSHHWIKAAATTLEALKLKL